MGTDVRDGNGTTRVINWCGCIVHDPHPAVRALGFLPEEGHGVYVARYDICSNLQVFHAFPDVKGYIILRNCIIDVLLAFTLTSSA